jgi:hypothetical protein
MVGVAVAEAMGVGRVGVGSTDVDGRQEERRMDSIRIDARMNTPSPLPLSRRERGEELGWLISRRERGCLLKNLGVFREILQRR